MAYNNRYTAFSQHDAPLTSQYNPNHVAFSRWQAPAITGFSTFGPSSGRIPCSSSKHVSGDGRAVRLSAAGGETSESADEAYDYASEQELNQRSAPKKGLMWARPKRKKPVQDRVPEDKPVNKAAAKKSSKAKTAKATKEKNKPLNIVEPVPRDEPHGLDSPDVEDTPLLVDNLIAEGKTDAQGDLLSPDITKEDEGNVSLGDEQVAEQVFTETSMPEDEDDALEDGQKHETPEQPVEAPMTEPKAAEKLPTDMKDTSTVERETQHRHAEVQPISPAASDPPETWPSDFEDANDSTEDKNLLSIIFAPEVKSAPKYPIVTKHHKSRNKASKKASKAKAKVSKVDQPSHETRMSSPDQQEAASNEASSKENELAADATPVVHQVSVLRSPGNDLDRHRDFHDAQPDTDVPVPPATEAHTAPTEDPRTDLLGPPMVPLTLISGNVFMHPHIASPKDAPSEKGGEIERGTEKTVGNVKPGHIAFGNADGKQVQGREGVPEDIDLVDDGLAVGKAEDEGVCVRHGNLKEDFEDEKLGFVDVAGIDDDTSVVDGDDRAVVNNADDQVMDGSKDGDTVGDRNKVRIVEEIKQSKDEEMEEKQNDEHAPEATHEAQALVAVAEEDLIPESQVGPTQPTETAEEGAIALEDQELEPDVPANSVGETELRTEAIIVDHLDATQAQALISLDEGSAPPSPVLGSSPDDHRRSPRVRRDSYSAKRWVRPHNHRRRESHTSETEQPVPNRRQIIRHRRSVLSDAEDDDDTRRGRQRTRHAA